VLFYFAEKEGETVRRQKLSLLLIGVLLVFVALRPRIGYRAVRAVARLLPLDQGYSVVASDNFVLYYDEEDAVAQGVLLQLEQRLAELQEHLPDQSPKPIRVRLHATSDSMGCAIGGEYSATLGAYQLGKLELLSPVAWHPRLGQAAALAVYEREGPVTHELAHLLLDYLCPTGYPVWFSEGFAQYWEMRLQGYVWDEGDWGWVKQPASLTSLENSFRSLPETVAYQQSLSLMIYLYETVGDGGMQEMLLHLQEGQSLQGALEQAVGHSLERMEANWQVWLQDRLW